MHRGSVAGLADPRVQPEIRHEPVGRREPGEVPDRRHDRYSDGDIDTRDGHQSSHDQVVDRVHGDVSFDLGELVTVEVELPEQRFDAAPLISGQVLAREPLAADAGEQVRVRARRHKVPRQDPMHLVLQPGALLDQMGPSGHQPAAHPCSVVRDPSLGQEVRGQQLGQDPSVDLVGLDLRLGDRSGLARVRHHNTGNERAQHRRDRIAVRRRLQRNLVVALEGRCPLAQVLGLHADPALVSTEPVLDDGDLRERAMHVHPDRSHHATPHFSSVMRNRWAEATETDSRSQRSQASRGGGHVQTRARSSRCRSACPGMFLRTPRT